MAKIAKTGDRQKIMDTSKSTNLWGGGGGGADFPPSSIFLKKTFF